MPELLGAMAHAAARYGHVIHPETAVEPSAALAEALVRTAGAGWADRAFFSDDGCDIVIVVNRRALLNTGTRVRGVACLYNNVPTYYSDLSVM